MLVFKNENKNYFLKQNVSFVYVANVRHKSLNYKIEKMLPK
jgi:hypothetical protein